MAVAALSGAGFNQYIAAASNVSASQQAFNSLQQSLASGDLSGAKAAFNTYQQVNQAVSTAAASGSGSSGSSSSSQYSSDMKTLGNALSSGNLATAESAFTTLQNDMSSSPSQAIMNAENAATATVGWIDDLLNLSNPNYTSPPPVDPTYSILNNAYGQSNGSNNSDSASNILNSTYGSNNGSTSTADNGATTGSSPTSTTSTADYGNSGSAASVNVYA